MLGSWSETANKATHIARSWPGIELRVRAFNPAYDGNSPFIGQSFSATFNDSSRSVGELFFWVLRSERKTQSYEFEILMEDWLSSGAKEVVRRLTSSNVELCKKPSIIITNFDVEEEYRLASLEVTFDYLKKDVLAILPVSEISQIVIDEPALIKAPDSSHLVSRLMKKEQTPVLVIRTSKGAKSPIEETYYEF